MLLGETAVATLFNGVLTNKNDSMLNVKHKRILGELFAIVVLVKSSTGRDR